MIFKDGLGERILLVGLNPGSCKLSDPNEWNKFLLSQDITFTGPIAVDQTMNHIICMLKAANPSFNGTLHLTNLFNLRCAKINDAVKLYAELKNDKLLLPHLETDFEDLLINYQYSFAWLGWSLRKSRALNERKRSLKKIIQVSLPTVARCKSDNLKEIHKWHFKPLLKSDADQYR